jgi:hypothetical protein
MYYTHQTHRFYLLCLILTSVSLVGCKPDPLPPIVPVAVEVKAPPSNADDDEAILAISISDVLGNTVNPSPDITPTPGPSPIKVGDKCPVCEGRGKSGDGIQPCGPCNGDGRVDTGDPVLSTEVAPTTEEHSVVVQHVRQDAFQAWAADLQQQTEEDNAKLLAKIEEFKTASDQATSRINELEAKIGSLTTTIEKLGTDLLSLQEKAAAKAVPTVTPTPKAASAPTGYWKTTRVKKCDGRGSCWYENVRTWIPYTTSNPQSSVSPSDPYYPTRGSLWSGCSSWKHLTQGEHRGKFDSAWLQGLSWQELQSLHSDHHSGTVHWEYVIRGSNG